MFSNKCQIFNVNVRLCCKSAAQFNVVQCGYRTILASQTINTIFNVNVRLWCNQQPISMWFNVDTAQIWHPNQNQAIISTNPTHQMFFHMKSMKEIQYNQQPVNINVRFWCNHRPIIASILKFVTRNRQRTKSGFNPLRVHRHKKWRKRHKNTTA